MGIIDNVLPRVAKNVSKDYLPKFMYINILLIDMKQSE